MNLLPLFSVFAALALFGQTQNATLNPKVQFTTNLGSFTVQLNTEAAPMTVENFIGYAKTGFYKGTTFHRVISTFMVQAGGYSVSGEQKATKAPVVNEAKRTFEMGLKNVRGSIAMARTSNPDSATSQFFINVVDNAYLDYPSRDGAGYCVFGYVVEGMDTIDKIRDVKTLPGDSPAEPVVITDTKVIGLKTAVRKSAPKTPAAKKTKPKNKR
jgi:peptidyl-prolyl cis-trans isomerase A (cyclophilin A)